MKTEIEALGHVITGMRAAYARGENVMAWARANSTLDDKIVSTLIAYDLQAGTYVENARNNPVYIHSWSVQLAGLIDPYISSGDRILEVGVGEATTLAGLMKAITAQGISAYGFDLSWSRIAIAKRWMDEKSVKARLFVGDLFSIPLADSSVDVVYTSHSLEPK
jgi:SAM-dependent methyltransferase